MAIRVFKLVRVGVSTGMLENRDFKPPALSITTNNLMIYYFIYICWFPWQGDIFPMCRFQGKSHLATIIDHSCTQQGRRSSYASSKISRHFSINVSLTAISVDLFISGFTRWATHNERKSKANCYCLSSKLTTIPPACFLFKNTTKDDLNWAP